MAAPHRDRAAPTAATQSTRGRRTGRMMLGARDSASCARPSTALTSVRTVSFSGRLTLPRHTHSNREAAVTAVNRTYMAGLNPSPRCFILFTPIYEGTGSCQGPLSGSRGGRTALILRT